MGLTSERLVELLTVRGPATAAEIKAALGVGPTVLSRLVASSRGRVLRIGRARATRYAVAREIRTSGHSWSVSRIDGSGVAQHAARLHALVPRAWWYESVARIPSWVSPDFSLGIFPDLPWFLDDARPEGFLGRAFARRHAEQLGLAADPRHWDAAAVLTALLNHGHDLPGDFVIGDAMIQRVQQSVLTAPDAVDVELRARRYPELVAAVLSDGGGDSSAGGDQPKFTTCLREDAAYRHVLTKFSPPRDTSVGRRWADLLVCEHLASETLRSEGVAAVRTELLDYRDRTYLEVTRFDRVGAHGRRGVCSLLALDNAHYGRLDSWRSAADRLERDRWLSREDAGTLRLLWWFARLIANTDVHFGNVSLMLNHSLPLELAPAYDMLPMHYRPTAAGEVVAVPFIAPPPTPEDSSTWSRAARMAERFWKTVAEDTRVSVEFRAEVRLVAGELRQLIEHFGEAP